MRLALTLVLSFFTLQAFATIRTYFNGTTHVNYRDPYRQVTRPGHDLESVLLEQIESAQKSIYVAVQELRLPLIAKKLVEKHREGVDVRLILENSYNHNVMAQPNLPETQSDSHDSTRYRELVMLIDVNRDGRVTRQEMAERDAVFILQQARVPLIDDTHDGSAGSGLMHHKFVVIDGKKVVASSANFTPSCIHGDIGAPASRGNANGLMVIESHPLARIFQEEFMILWEGQFGVSKPFRGARTVRVDGKAVTVQFSPSSSAVAWDVTSNGLINKAMIGAKKSIDAALFVFSDQALADGMKQAHRKATIRVLVEPRFAFRSYSEVLDLLGVQMLDNNCVYEPGNAPWRPALTTAGEANLPDGDVLHHKFAVVDERKVIFGSHNWSTAANMTNDEFLLVIDDVEVASSFGQEFSRLSQLSHWGLPRRVQSDIRRVSQECAQR